MKVEFDKRECRYLHRLAAEIQSQEQTQELRLTEGMPDIGSIIGAWGQVLIRGKEWRGDSMIVSGGVMVWTLYAPEDGSGVQKVEGWLPFQIKWQLPDTPRDGVILAAPYLRSVDARSISARKLMLRTVLRSWRRPISRNKRLCIFQARFRVICRCFGRSIPFCCQRKQGSVISRSARRCSCLPLRRPLGK